LDSIKGAKEDEVMFEIFSQTDNKRIFASPDSSILVDRFIKYFTNKIDYGIEPLKPRRMLCQEKAKEQNLS